MKLLLNLLLEKKASSYRADPGENSGDYNLHNEKLKKLQMPSKSALSVQSTFPNFSSPIFVHL